jgi:hypothetical protein
MSKWLASRTAATSLLCGMDGARSIGGLSQTQLKRCPLDADLNGPEIQAGT